MPIPTWSEEWLAWKSAITHALGRYFACQKGFKAFRRDIAETNVLPKTKRLLSKGSEKDTNV